MFYSFPYPVPSIIGHRIPRRALFLLRIAWWLLLVWSGPVRLWRLAAGNRGIFIEATTHRGCTAACSGATNGTNVDSLSGVPLNLWATDHSDVTYDNPRATLLATTIATAPSTGCRESKINK